MMLYLFMVFLTFALVVLSAYLILAFLCDIAKLFIWL